MQQHLYRVNEGGRIVGESVSSLEDATANLGPGEKIAPYEPGVTPTSHRWSDEGGWVELPETQVDWRDLRRGSMPSQFEQSELLSDLLFAFHKDPRFREFIGAELSSRVDRLQSHVRAVKDRHPKPKTPAA